MKIRLTLKDPDGVWDGIQHAARNHVEDVSCSDPNSEICKEMIESTREVMEDAISPWIEFGEYVTIEIDTTTNTARVVKVGQ